MVEENLMGNAVSSTTITSSLWHTLWQPLDHLRYGIDNFMIRIINVFNGIESILMRT
jgi:hypothetical protein